MKFVDKKRSCRVDNKKLVFLVFSHGNVGVYEIKTQKLNLKLDNKENTFNAAKNAVKILVCIACCRAPLFFIIHSLKWFINCAQCLLGIYGNS